MNYIEVAVLIFFGLLLVIIGSDGIKVYAKLFLNVPTATLSANLVLASLKGPGIIAVLLCGMAFLGGIYCIALSIYIIIIEMGPALLEL